jgi:hypothetical protein
MKTPPVHRASAAEILDRNEKQRAHPARATEMPRAGDARAGKSKETELSDG